MMEILAPCGSPEHIPAAVFCGADAVYLGGKRLSARQNAANFDEQALSEAVRLCHLYGVKVYQTINTLVRDDELTLVYDAVKVAVAAGVDAIIVADMGAAAYIRKLVPDMPLHASTQMSIHDAYGAELAQRMGFTRAVLARELSLKQIEFISQNTSIELEVFVHGALCCSVSGQCYLSGVIGGRSGNRGLCAQPCRLNSQAGGREYALSLKDLSVVDSLSAIKGVTALKIEGRMKRPEYVAAAVTACRQALDGEKPDLERLRSVFSRSGFTDSYIAGTKNSMHGVRKKEDVVSAEGVLPELEALYAKPRARYGVSMHVECTHGEAVTASAKCGGLYACVSGDPPQAAKTRGITAEDAEKQLVKLGGTPFYADGFSADIDDGLFVPAAGFNELRRRLVAALEERLIAKNTPKFIVNDSKPVIKKTVKAAVRPALHAELQTVEQFLAVKDMVELAALPLSCFAEGGLAEHAERLAVNMPRLMTADVLPLLQALKVQGFDKMLCQNLAHVNIGQKLGFRMFGGVFLNVMNSYAVEVLRGLGVESVTLSSELTLSQLPTSGIPTGVLAYGKIPVMLLARCPVHDRPLVKNCGQCVDVMTDRTNRKFPIRCNGDYMELLNSTPIWMADRLAELKTDFITLMFDSHAPQEVAEIVRAYVSGGEPPTDYTRGMLYRGVE